MPSHLRTALAATAAVAENGISGAGKPDFGAAMAD
ncbi:hypothetical protein GA0115257_104819 [Streptomyces sp. LcepLS]|nr:hypothetical protein GA0115257_104819 [Streptomyces sp. LcepLS]